MNTLATALYLIVGVINMIPVSGVLSASRLQDLYGVTILDPNLIILMRHRAVLFGIIGAVLIAAAFHPPLQTIAFIAGLVSMLSFVLIAYLVGELNAELRRVAFIDLVASLLLISAELITLWSGSRDPTA